MLAKLLRADGRREDAARVAKLRKPSAAAGAVNQLVRTQPDALDRVLAAGDALRETQERVFAGDATPAELRAAVEEERDAVQAAVDAAALTGAVRERAAETLHAAAADAEAREVVIAGRLEQELQRSGFGEAGFAMAAPPAAPRAAKTTARTAEPAPEPKRAAKTTAKSSAADAERAARERAEREAREQEEREARERERREREREQARAGARAAIREARREAEAAAARAASAERDHANVLETLQRAQQRLERTRSESEAAAERLADAEAALEAI